MDALGITADERKEIMLAMDNVRLNLSKMTPLELATVPVVLSDGSIEQHTSPNVVTAAAPVAVEQALTPSRDAAAAPEPENDCDKYAAPHPPGTPPGSIPHATDADWIRIIPVCQRTSKRETRASPVTLLRSANNTSSGHPSSFSPYSR